MAERRVPCASVQSNESQLEPVDRQAMSDFERLAREYLDTKFPDGDPVEIGKDPLAASLVTLEREGDLEQRTAEATASTPAEMDEGAAPNTPSLPGNTEGDDFPAAEIDRKVEIQDEPEQFKIEDPEVDIPDVAPRGDDSSDRVPSQLIYTPEGQIEKGYQEYEQPDVRLEKEADVMVDFNTNIQDTTIVPKNNEEFTKMLDDIDKRVVVPEYKSPDDIPLPKLPDIPDLSVLIPNAADAEMAAAGVNLMNWERQ